MASLTRRGVFGLAASVPLWPKMLGAGKASSLKLVAGTLNAARVGPLGYSSGLAQEVAMGRAYRAANGLHYLCGEEPHYLDTIDEVNAYLQPRRAAFYKSMTDGTATAPFGVFSVSTSDV